MDELSLWIKVGKKVGIHFSKFQRIKDEVYGNLELIQDNITALQEKYLENLAQGKDLSLSFGVCLDELQRRYSKQTEYIILRCLETTLKAMQKRYASCKEHNKIKKLMISCLIVKNHLRKYTNRPFEEIIQIGLGKIDSILKVLRCIKNN